MRRLGRSDYGIQRTRAGRTTSSVLLMLTLCATIFAAQPPSKAASYGTNQAPATTWVISPSFKFDTLCFLNTLTGDPFYTRYYQSEYDRFRPLLTPAAKSALGGLKRKVKDEDKSVVSAFLSVIFSASEARTLDEMLKTLEDDRKMRAELRRTPYYSENGWRLYKSVRPELKTIFSFLKEAGFEAYWEKNIRPQVVGRIEELKGELSGYDVVGAVERYRGSALPSRQVTVYLLFYSHPHGIKVTGTRFLANQRWPYRVILQNAVHELFHPPYDLARDRELADSLSRLRKDEFLMGKIANHNPDFGYNSFETFVEEDCVRALEQLANESLHTATDARRRWLEEDDGMHVLAVTLYSIMKEENYNRRRESFRDFLVGIIKSSKLSAGKIRPRYEAFYSRSGP